MAMFGLAALLLGASGCYDEKDQAPSQRQPNAPKISDPNPVSSAPVKPVDPVSANWNETGQQGLDGKTCSTWWNLSGQTPTVFFQKAAEYVKTTWPAGSFTLVDAVTASYVMPIEKNLFGEVRNAKVTLTTATSPAGAPCAQFQATLRAEDLSETSKTAQQEAARLCLATTGNGGQSDQQTPTLPTQNGSQPKASEFKLLFPLGKPDSPSARYEPHTAVISSVFDHRMKHRYDPGLRSDLTWGVTAFTGETATQIVTVDHFPVEINAGQKLYVFAEPSAAFLTGYKLEPPGNYLAYDGHPGYDFPIQKGTRVYAAAAGTVVWAGEKQLGKSGFFVRILHTNFLDGSRFVTQYLHLSAPETKLIGLNVVKNQFIGLSGNTGTDGYHLHFEVKKEGKEPYYDDDANGPFSGGVPIDPYGWAPKDGRDPYGPVNKSVNWGERNGDSVWMWENPPPVVGD